MRFRTELKYICTEPDLFQIESKISRLLCIDKHGNYNDKTYIVHSLYFDDFNNSCLFDYEMGTGKRYKYRARFYNNDVDYLILEKKIKNNGYSYKKTCRLSLQQLAEICEGHYMNIFWETDNELLREFCVDCETRLFKPKVITEYKRKAYVDPNLNIRITIDRNICGSIDIERFTENNYVRFPVQDSSYAILEVKYDDFLPEYIKNCIYDSDLNQTTCSKYYMCRKIIERS